MTIFLPSFKYWEIFHLNVRKIFRKTNISYSLIRSRTWLSGGKKWQFFKKIAYVLNGWSLTLNVVTSWFPCWVYSFTTTNVVEYCSTLKHMGTLRRNRLTLLSKWSNTLKQLVDNLPTNCVSIFDHFMGLTLKGLKFSSKYHTIWHF